MTPARREERGVTVVEAAFVIPLIFLFALGLIDVGLWVFQTGQASSAARDGARVGILKYKTGESGADFNRIEAEVNSRLAGQGGVSVTVTCVKGTSDVPCNSVTADDQPKPRIKVAVSWDRPALTPVSAVFGAQKVDATASMAIVGLPTP